MIKPTRRTVAIFAAGIPPALFFAIEAPQLWPLSLAYGAAVLIAVAGDGLAALSARDVAIDYSLPDRLYIGDQGEITGTLAVRAYRRPVRFQVLSEQTGHLDPPKEVEVELDPGRVARFAISLVPRRRGRIEIEQLWVRW